MFLRPPRPTRTYTHFPVTTLVRSLQPLAPGPGAHSAAMTAFCTCSRFSASSMAMQPGESITASVALTLRRSGRQWENTPSLRSEEHTSELQSLMRISYAVFCLQQKYNHNVTHLDI